MRKTLGDSLYLLTSRAYSARRRASQLSLAGCPDAANLWRRRYLMHTRAVRGVVSSEDSQSLRLNSSHINVSMVME